MQWRYQPRDRRFRAKSRHRSGPTSFLPHLALAAMASGLLPGCLPGSDALRTEIDPIRYPSGMGDLHTAQLYVRTPRPKLFSVCHEHTCRAISNVSLAVETWETIRREFAVPAPDPAAERDQIAAAVASMETLVGDRTGTARDREQTFPGLGEPGQMDCVDEATNTTAYLIMLQQDGLLRWHSAGPRLSRGVERLQALHFTATLDETATGARFAVDSWFGPNGSQPDIVPLDKWLRGWEPRADAARSASVTGLH